MRVQDVMIPSPPVVSPEMSVAEAARRLLESDARCLLAGSGTLPNSIVTEHDIIVRLVAAGSEPGRIRVREIASVELQFCRDTMAAEDAAKLMRAAGIRRMPVLDRRRRLVGLVLLADVDDARVPATRPDRHSVTFYKRLADSYGKLRLVPIERVHVASCHQPDEIAAAAIRRFERNHGDTAWSDLADAYEIDHAGAVLKSLAR